jgi:hypothetical protein
MVKTKSRTPQTGDQRDLDTADTPTRPIPRPPDLSSGPPARDDQEKTDSGR